MKPASGNSNDMEGFKQIVKAHIGSLQAAQASRYLVADAALYVKETIKDLDAQGQLFITRVPQTLKEAKELIKQAPSLTFTPISLGNEGPSYDSEYGGVKQKWILIRSEQSYKREQHNLNKRMLKAGEQARKSLKTLCQQRFGCAQDAQTAIIKWQDKQAVCDVSAQVTEVTVYASAGRPKLGELPIRIEIQITGKLYTPLASRQTAYNNSDCSLLPPMMSVRGLIWQACLAVTKPNRMLKKAFAS